MDVAGVGGTLGFSLGVWVMVSFTRAGCVWEVSRCWHLRLVELELSGNSTCFPFPPLGLEPSAEERTVTASLQTLGPGE